jgi:hypothetical protein
MSFKEFSSAHSAPAKDKPGDKPKYAPAADQPPAQPEKTPAEVALAPNS